MVARYTRQSRLADVGERGQERLLGTQARVPEGGLAHEIEARYLAAAGVKVVRAPRAEGAALEVDPEPGHMFADPAARAVAEGARRALDVICAALATPESST
ncbi:MAG: hypothetical protein JWM74_2087 [Myxococcaceae bacterium]|nr:hypothetical protein [Myxococcaceae bacterium]